MKRTYLFSGAALVAAVTLATGVSVTACGKKKSSTTATASTDVTISGALSLATSLTDGANLLSTTYDVYCVTFSTPPAAGSGAVDPTTGAFSLTLSGAKDQAFGCFVRDAATASTVASLTFEDTSSTGMDGNSLKKGSISLGSSANLGAITLDLAKGVATVNMANIATAVSTAATTTTKWDFTGTWTFGALSATEFAPYKAQGFSEAPASGDGPHVGMPIYMQRLHATKSGSDLYGLQVWESLAAFNTCGGKFGLSDADMAEEGLTAVSPTGGEFSWSTTTVGGSTITNGWKIANATTPWSIGYCAGSFDASTGNCGDWQQQLAQNANCSSATSGSAAEAKCYAQWIWNNSSDLDGKCYRRVEIDWSNSSSTATGSDIIYQGEFWKPRNLFLMEKGEYLTANTFNSRSIQERMEGVQVSGRFVPCKIIDDLNITVSKIDDTTALLEFSSSKKLIDTKTICVQNEANMDKIGSFRSVFKMTKSQ
jgi:hypothetical protein